MAAATSSSPPAPPPYSSTFARGALAGSVSAVVLQPLDVLKTRLQVSGGAGSLGSAGGSGSSGLGRLLGSSGLTGIVQREGARSLWNGLTPSLGRVCFGAGTYFCTLDWMHQIFPSQNNFVVGATARAIACTITCPLTVVKTRFEGMPSVVLDRGAVGGAGAEATRGRGGAVTGEAGKTGAGTGKTGAAGARTGATEVKAGMRAGMGEAGAVSAASAVGAASAAGAASATNSATSTAGAGVTRRSVIGALVQIAATERMAGLFSGLGATIARDAPFSGAYLLLYGLLNDWADAALEEKAGGGDRTNGHDGHDQDSGRDMAARRRGRTVEGSMGGVRGGGGDRVVTGSELEGTSRVVGGASSTLPSLYRGAPPSAPPPPALSVAAAASSPSALSSQPAAAGGSAKRSGTFGQHLTVGFVAGAIATALTHPFDVIKTRMQMDMGATGAAVTTHGHGSGGSAGGRGGGGVNTASGSGRGGGGCAARVPGARLSLAETVRDVLRSEGARGFLRGVTFRLIRRPLGTGIVWAVYEELK